MSHLQDPMGSVFVGDVWQIWDTRTRPDGGTKFIVEEITNVVGSNPQENGRIARRADEIRLLVGVRNVIWDEETKSWKTWGPKGRWIDIERFRPNSTGYRCVERSKRRDLVQA